MLRSPLAGRFRLPFAMLALALLAALAVGALWSEAASAASGCSATTNLKTWKTAAATSDWGTSSNWTPSGVPSSSSNICIPTGVSTTPVVSANSTVASLEVRSALAVNSGTLKVTGATLVSSTATLSGGTLSVPNTGTLEVASGGTVDVPGGTLTVASGTAPAGIATVDSGGTLSDDYTGVITGGGKIVVNGTMNWASGSTQNGAGTTEIASGGTMAMAESGCNCQRQLNARTVTIDSGGTATQSGNSDTWVGDSAVINVAGTLDLQADIGIDDAGGTTTSAGTMHVTGVLKKSAGTGTSNISVPVDNDGTVHAISGDLQFSGGSGGSTGAGTWQADSGKHNYLLSGTFKFGNSTISGAGAGLDVNGGDLSIASGATATVASGSTLVDDYTGSVDGAGTLLVQGTMNWLSGSNQIGSGTTEIASGGTMAMAESGCNCQRQLNARTVTIDSGATATESGNSDTWVGDSAVINVAGTLDIQADLGIDDGGGTTTSAGTIHVTGVLKKSAGTGASNIYVPVDTTGGTVRADSGDLILVNPANWNATTTTLGGGTYAATGSGVLDVNGAQPTTLNGIVSLTGSSAHVRDASGNDVLTPVTTIGAGGGVTLAGGANFTVPQSLASSGTVNLGSSDTLNVTGNYSQTSGGTYAVGIAPGTPAAGSTYGQIKATGTSSVAGALTVNAPGVSPTSGQSWKILASTGARSGTFNALPANSPFAAQYNANDVSLVPNKPVITSFSPTSGNAGSTVVTINGTGLSGATAVNFNAGTSGTGGIAVTPASSTATQVTAVVPNGAATGKLSVTTPNGTGISSGTFTVSFVVKSFSPACAATGSAVTVTGTGFTNTSTVAFHGTTGSTTYVSKTSLVATVPSGATSGTVSVTKSGVTTTSVKSLSIVTAVVPHVTKITPATTATGKTVTFAGTGFCGATSVHFGALASPTVTVSSATKLTAVVPDGAGNAPVSVSTNAGTSTGGPTFVPTLSAQSFTPTSGGAGSSVTITGFGFNSSSTVKFGTVSASVLYDSSTGNLNAIIPSGLALNTPVTISVTNTTGATGTVKAPGTFTRTS